MTDILTYNELTNLKSVTISPKKTVQLINNPVELTIPTYDGANQPVHPSVVYLPDGWNGYKY